MKAEKRTTKWDSLLENKAANLKTILWTSEDRFRDLPGYAFEPHYIDVYGARVHYVDEGEGEPILCDPVTAGGDRFFRALIPGAPAQPQITIHDAGHFLQVEKGNEISAHILEFRSRTPR